MFLSDFEGPDGEGSPIAPVVGIFIVTILFVVPWTIVAIRSLKRLSSKRISAQTTNVL
jgi:hypothetical protein